MNKCTTALRGETIKSDYLRCAISGNNTKATTNHSNILDTIW